VAEEGFKRKLTAILSADVAGYSRLMGEDEEATVRTLTAYRDMMTTLIKRHRGRVVDSPGDNLLAEFASVTDAVRCAVEIQEELRVKNTELPEDRKMEFRIGVNIGDVIEERERIYGDGVNIAARVEGLAEAGGICISGTVYEHIKDKLALLNEYMGEHPVKNIKEPVRVYRVRMEPGPEAPKVVPLWRRKTVLVGALAVLVLLIGVGVWNFYFRPPPMEPASEERMAFPLPDKPSIAVLPFVNMSGDPEQEYFSDGLTDDLITDLSKLSGLFVIARNSVFTYKEKPVKVQQVEGSVRKAGEQVRINAQLIDATTGHHLWAERYDSHIGDVFALQDRITGKIVTALALKLTEGEQKQVARKYTDNIEAHDAFLRGRQHYVRGSPDDWAKAVQYFERAIELDSNYGRAYAALALIYCESSHNLWHDFLGVSWEKACELAKGYLQKAMNNPTALAHQVASKMLIDRLMHEEAVAEAQLAIALDPNDANSYLTMAYALIYTGRPKEAFDFVERAMRLDPLFPAPYLDLYRRWRHHKFGPE
jgi:adenylate cyclase